jgi:hypothetical protein
MAIIEEELFHDKRMNLAAFERLPVDLKCT